MNPPLISVITPTFNSGVKIAATVASVLSQGKGLYEFLVIDGMERTLKENFGFLQIEIFASDPAGLRRRVNELGYRYLGTVEFDHFFTNIPGIE